ncbi:MAG: tRNA (guanosine(37)-N1)-methyltransferase TrmD [Acidobacteriota bacterium]
MTSQLEFVVVTIFPEMFPGALAYGVVGKALQRGLIELSVQDLREFAEPPHRQVDDAPFGGGAGMVLKPEPLFECVESIIQQRPARRPRVILLDPAGRTLCQPLARELSREKSLVLLCGRYEGVDERVREHLVDDVISIGDYVLSGGEIPAMVAIDSIARLVPGVVGEPASIERESFEESVLDHPHYTRPAEFRGLRVPDVLLSGHHAQIDAWRRGMALARTQRLRPDFLQDHKSAADSAERK